MEVHFLQSIPSNNYVHLHRAIQSVYKPFTLALSYRDKQAQVNSLAAAGWLGKIAEICAKIFHLEGAATTF